MKNSWRTHEERKVVFEIDYRLDDGEQKMMDKIFNKKQSERVEVELRSEFERDITIKRLIDQRLDRLLAI